VKISSIVWESVKVTFEKPVPMQNGMIKEIEYRDCRISYQDQRNGSSILILDTTVPMRSLMLCKAKILSMYPQSMDWEADYWEDDFGRLKLTPCRIECRF